MTVVRIKPIGQYPDVRKLADNARGAFDESLNAIGTGAKRDFEEITANWKHKPTWVLNRTKYTVSVQATGPNAKIFNFVDLGTSAHTIRAKGTRRGARRGKKLLTFKTGYQAKTRAGNTKFRGSGASTGGFISKAVVHHPGSQAREFTRIIRNKWQKDGRAVLRAALGKRKLPL